VDSLKRELISAKQDTNKVLLLADLAEKYGFMQPDSSFYYARQTLDLSQKLNYQYGECLGYRNLYFAFFTLGDYPKALETEFNALKIAEQMPDRRQSSMARIHMLLGFIYRGMGDYPKALSHHWEAERLQVAAGESLGEIHTSFNTPTQVYLELKILDSALWYTKKVYELGQQSNTLSSIDLAIMGDVYGALGNDTLAANYYTMGVELSKKDGDSYFRARLYNNLSNLFGKSGKFDSSIYFAQAALQISRVNKFLNYQLNSAKILARIYESQDKPDSTVKYLKLTMAISDSIFGQSKIRQFQTTQFIEEQRQQELKNS
jgi:tetratricopeptide (TPR) repeat protein